MTKDGNMRCRQQTLRLDLHTLALKMLVLQILCKTFSDYTK